MPTDLNEVKDIFSGNDYSIAIKNDGTIVGWGSNEWGQLNFPEMIEDIVQVIPLSNFVVALKADGTLVSWGLQQPEEFYAPKYKDLKYVAFYSSTIFCVKKDGTAYDEGFNSAQTNILPKNLENVKKIIVDNGFVACLFENDTSLIMGDFISTLTGSIETVYDIKNIVGRPNKLMLLKNDGSILTRGFDTSGIFDIPEKLTKVSEVSMGYFYVLALGKMKE